jgi:hypothetical protein
MSQSLVESWRTGAVKALQKQFAALVGTDGVKP